MKLNIKRDKEIKVNVTPNWLMLLGVIFVLLKVCGVSDVADWSWWLVLLPFYAGLAFVAAVIMALGALAGIVFAGAFILDVFDKIKRKTKRKF